MLAFPCSARIDKNDATNVKYKEADISNKLCGGEQDDISI